MRPAKLAVSTAILIALTMPVAASGHETVAGHKAEDSTPVKTLSQERALTRETLAVTAADAGVAAAAAAGDPGDVGSWTDPVDWPVVGVHVALMPDGKVLAYDSVGDHASETYQVHDHTRATLWDPKTGSHTDVTVTTGYNVFCSGLAHLFDGSLFVAGGNKNAQLNGIVQTHVFNPQTGTWSLGRNMQYERWYPSVTALRNGEMLITDGGPDLPEIRATDGTLRTLTTAGLDLPLYPWMDVAPDGKTFYSGPDQTMRKLDTSGTGSWTNLGARDTINRTYGGHALYDIGKELVAGGGPSTATARVINLNGATPTSTATGSLAYGRRQNNLTVLADGTVLATGGNSSGEDLVDLANGVYAAERWNPATGQWSTLAAQRVTRQYHSSALLLPDGRVLSSGGGICGACDSDGYLAKNAEVFTPPYLYKHDGSGALATRPTIASAPSTVPYGATFTIATPDAAAIRKVALIRLGAVTHSNDMDQRYVPLTFAPGAAGELTATGPANANIAPPGPYMLVVVDDQGVPSVSKMVSLPLGNSPPSVSIGQPTAGDSFTAPATVGITAAASDADGTVAKVEFFNGTTKLGEDTTAPYAYSWTGVAAGSYTLTAKATDNSANVTTSGSVPITVTAPSSGPAGLVGAWGFEESSGASVTDSSGKANTGTISGATRTASGRFGSALSFNGTSDSVAVPGSTSLNLTSKGTLEAWLYPTAIGGWRTGLLKERPGGLSYALYAGTSSGGSPAGEYDSATGGQTLYANNPLPVNQWTHLATTWDGTTQRLYVDGVQVTSRPSTASALVGTGALKFGGNAIWGEWFAGRMDEVRVYDRALTAAEVQADRTSPVSGTTPPPASPVLAVSPASLSFAATAGGAAPGAKSVDVTNTGGGSLAYTVAKDQPWLAVTPAGGSAPGTVSVSVDPTGLAAGTYSGTVTVTATGVTGSPKTIPVTFTVSATPPPAGSGLVGAWGFEEASGTAATDSSGTGNGGTLDGPARTSAGRFGAALDFDGVNDSVSVPDAASLDLAAKGTVEAWVYPTATGGWRTAVLKQSAGGLTYGLYANSSSNLPDAELTTTSGDQAAQGTTQLPLNQWSHVATTWDGAQLKLYVNGTQAASGAMSGSALDGSGPLRFGGNSIWGEWFKGRLDEIRVYDRTLTAAEVQADSTTPVSGTTPPPASPVLAVSPASLSFAATAGAAAPAAKTVNVTNTGGGTLAYTVAKDQPWLAVTPAGGSAPGTVSVSVDPTGLAAGTYSGTVTVTATGVTGSPKTIPVTLTVSAAPPAGGGLVGAWSFNETSGSTVADSSGQANTGTVVGATRTTAGKFGGALTFNGSSTSVSVPDKASLDLAATGTVEAWVYPTTLSGWRTAVLKETAGGLAYGLYANSSSNLPDAEMTTTSGDQAAQGPTKLPVNQWSHLAMVWDGSTLKLYVNGVQKASNVMSGSALNGSGPLRFGGNAVWGEYFAGRLDEIRVYNRALSQAEVQADSTTAIG